MASLLIVSTTLSIPGFIMSETTLSYLGLGISDPAVSWGSLINRDISTLSNLRNYPWLLDPVWLLLIVTLAFNFAGDALRDFFDPFATFVAILFSACTHKTPYTNRSQLILMSSQEELALGEKSYKESLSELKVITGTKDALRVQTIGQKIAVAANQSNYKWEFNLVEDNQANAFCLPGGKVVVYTGILKYAKNDDQLATVISHEVAHALARHGAERVTQGMIQQGVGLIGSVAVAATAPQYQNAFNQAYGLGSNLGVMLPYGRMQESEADEIGIYLMHKAGYNVNEATKFWKNMSEGKSGGNDFFSTHPSSQNRTKDIQAVINKIGNEAK